jgi:protein SCO1/2
MTARQLLLLLLLLGTLASCHRPDAAPQPAKVSAEPRSFEVRGIVRGLEPDGRSARIEHEEIPGYMAGMTMSFEVRDSHELDGLQPGDTVTFRLHVTEEHGWIDQLHKLETPRAAPVFERLPDSTPLALGELLPDQTLTDTEGHAVRLSDFRGKALAFTFFFTRCPYPDFCPRLSKGLAETQALLKARPDRPTNWHLASITIDPDYDTRERLKAYATEYGADPAHWAFLTAPLAEVTALGERFDLDFWRANPDEPITHNTRTVVIDTDGRVRWIGKGTDWKPATLAEQIIRASR